MSALESLIGATFGASKLVLKCQSTSILLHCGCHLVALTWESFIFFFKLQCKGSIKLILFHTHFSAEVVSCLLKRAHTIGTLFLHEHCSGLWSLHWHMCKGERYGSVMRMNFSFSKATTSAVKMRASEPSDTSCDLPRKRETYFVILHCLHRICPDKHFSLLCSWHVLVKLAFWAQLPGTF